jgi:predicted outer membrane protein
MSVRLLAAAIGAIVIASLAHAGDSSGFVEKAREAGDFEIATSQLALEKSKAPNVRKFAQQIIDDHTAAAQELEKAAAEGAPSAEKQPVKRADKHARDIERNYGRRARPSSMLRTLRFKAMRTKRLLSSSAPMRRAATTQS